MAYRGREAEAGRLTLFRRPGTVPEVWGGGRRRIAALEVSPGPDRPGGCRLHRAASARARDSQIPRRQTQTLRPSLQILFP